MHLHSFIAGAGLLAAANALLVPPKVTVPDGLITTLPAPAEDTGVLAALPKSWNVNMECPGCPVFGRAHRIDIPSRLKLDFSVQSTDGIDRLTVNGYELYPNPDPIHNTFSAPVLPEMSNRRIGTSPHYRGMLNPVPKAQPLGFAMGSQTVATDDDDDLELILIEIQIFEVGTTIVDHLPRARVNLVRTLSGKLAIGSVEVVPFVPPEEPVAEQKECSTALCKWRALVSEKISSVFSGMGCRGRRPSLPHAHHHANGSHHGHDAHARHMNKHKVFRVLTNIITHLVLPVLLGLVAGITIGIIITTIIAFGVMLWGAVFGRSDRQCRFSHRFLCRAARKEEEAVEGEKAGLLDGQEVAAPPPYEEKKPESEA